MGQTRELIPMTTIGISHLTSFRVKVKCIMHTLAKQVTQVPPPKKKTFIEDRIVKLFCMCLVLKT